MRIQSERSLQNSAMWMDNSSAGKESLYVSRNDLHATTRGLRTSKGARKPSTDKRTTRSNNYTSSARVVERNFLSHAEFPDVYTAAMLNSKEQSGSNNVRKESMNRCPTNNVGKFKPFDPNKAPAHFKNSNRNSQNYQPSYSGMIETSQYYMEQSPNIYQYIPPPAFGEVQYSQQDISMLQPNIYTPAMPSGASATAVAPSGERIYIPLDESKYELMRSNHDLYDMPQDCELHPLSSEGHFESNVDIIHSPRPIDTRGSLSDDWSSSGDEGRETETESEHETESTETDESEIANKYVTNLLKSITKSVEDLAVEEGITPIKEDNGKTEDIETSKGTESSTNKVIELDEEGLEMKVVENNENETVFESKENHEQGVQKIVISSSEADNDITAKRAKIVDDIQICNETLGKLDQSIDEAKINKRPTIKKSRAWKENRKEKQDKSKDKSKLYENENSQNDNRKERNDTQGIDQEFDGKDPSSGQVESVQHTPCVQHTPNASQNVMVDGQGYYQSNQIANGRYQPYYIPDNYTFVPNQYQQIQSSADPTYTMFIHDVCPPPRTDEEYNQVHKSLSGELINLTATSEQQSQIVEGSNNGQQSCGNVQTISDNASNYTAAEMIQSNTEVKNHHPSNTFSQGAESTSTPYTPNFYEQHAYYNQFNSGTVSDTPEAQLHDQGQLYVCYDEESVYVDPESGLSYPALHMTEDSLITVILREGVFLEITANKGLRLVNHDKKLVVAINDTGSKACVIHPAARIYQSDSSLHAELYLGRRAKMTDELVMFGNKLKTYKFDHRIVTEMTEEPVFRDLSHDDSISFLSTEFGIGIEETKLKMNEILSHAHFWKSGIRGSTVIINNTKIVQNEKGEVSVYCGPIRFLRMNPEKMILRLKTHHVEVDIETNWNVKVTRGSHALNASHIGFIVCNGKIKACLDSHNKFQSFSMPDHRALMLGQPVSHHRPGVPRERHRRAQQRKEEPEGDHWGYIQRNPDEDQTRVFREWEEGWDYNFEQRNINYYKRWNPEAGRWVYPSRQWRRRDRR